MVGWIFGDLTVIHLSEKRGYEGALIWTCKCKCGTLKDILGTSLRKGFTNSCGCGMKKTQFEATHRLSGTFEYTCWLGMKARCKNADGEHEAYTIKGIKVCKRWNKSFEAFLEDMGNAPTKKHTVGRKDNNGDYSPTNCRWETRTEQNRNLDTNRILIFNGKSMCVAAWAELMGVHQNLLYNRLAAGWDTERTLTTPKQNKGPKPKNITLKLADKVRNISPLQAIP